MKNFYLQPQLSSVTNKLARVARLVAILFIAGFFPAKLFGQAPIISYGTPAPKHLTAVAFAPINPSNSGGAVAAPTGACGCPVLLGSGLTFSINGAAVDAAGNIYVNDQVGSTGNVKKIAADGSSTTIIGSGFLNQSANVAVDPAGNVYVADQANVWKIPASGNPTTYGTPVVINNSFPRPFGITADAAGNIYVADLNAGVYKMKSNGTNKVKIDNGIASPSAVTVDGAGNVYAVSIADFKLYEIPANGSPQVVLASGFNFPRGLAVDATGKVYVDDEGAATIFTVPQGGGTPFAYVSGLTNVVGVAVDAGYHVIVALQGAGGMTRYSPTGGYFISPLLPAGLTFNTTTGVISGTPTASRPATDYVISGYNSDGGSSATINLEVEPVFFNYSSPQTFTAGTAITPLAPTITLGTIVPSGYKPGAVTLASGFLAPLGVAVDGAGNIYVADKGNSLVKKIPAGGSTPVSIGTGFTTPSGIAVDGKGNVYVADQASTSITEIPGNGDAQISMGSFGSPVGVAVDSVGNIYVADASDNSVYRLAANHGNQTIVVNGFYNITAIASDAAGNLYIADGSGQAVYRLRAGSLVTEFLQGSYDFPASIAVDAMGAVYVADGNAGKVYKILGQLPTPLAIGGTFGFPSGIAVDGTGKVIVADASVNVVQQITPKGGYYLDRTLPAGLHMAGATGIISGSPQLGSAATNYKITGYNNNGGYSTPVNITVNVPPVPIISYSTPQTYTAGVTIATVSPSASGGAVAAPAYSLIQQTLGSGFNQPGAVAVDGKGNVYVADATNNLVKKIPAGNGTPVNIGGGFVFSEPTGIAIDSLGNVYVADEGNSTVEMISASSGLTATTPIGTGISEPNAVAVDANGNVYVTDESTQSIYEILAGGAGTVTIATNFTQLTGIAVDAQGDVYAADGSDHAVYKNPTGSTGGLSIGFGFVYPTGLAVDPTGNIFVADQGTNLLYKISAKLLVTTAIVGSGFNNPGGIAVDGSGNLYIADTDNNAIEEISPVGGYFVNKALPTGLSMDNKTGSISGTPTVGSLATDYTITAYNAGGGGAANLNITVNLPAVPTISYVGPHIYPEGVVITPLAPTSSGVGAPAYNSGFTAKGTGYTEPQGVAIDAQGNIYVADPLTALLTKIPFDGSASVSIAPGTFSAPLGVALDAAGNIYVADGGVDPSTAAVYKVPVIAGVPGTPVTLGQPGDFGAPGAIAVDAAGNVYVGDLEFGAIEKIPAGGGPTTYFNFVFGYPGGVAVDAAGNVYVSDSGSGAPSGVFEISGGGKIKTRIGSGFALPTGVAVDASGNVFISDGGAGAIKEIPAGGGQQITINGFGLPFGIAADGKGNVFFSDDNDGIIKEIKPAGGYFIRPALPVGLGFNSTTGVISGTPTVASPATNYSVMAYSFGGGSSAGVNIEVASNDPALTQLVASKGFLTPVFATTKTNYTISEFNNVSSITITPTARDTNATIKINGTVVKSGQASLALPLSVGTNTITTIVTAQDGVTTQTYSIIVTRLPSTNAKLSNLVDGYAGITPTFSGAVTSYTQQVNNGVSSISITPKTFDPTATVTVNGSPTLSGSPSVSQPLVVGDNVFTVIVTAQDNTTQITYTLTVTRSKSANDNLFTLKSNRGGLTATVPPSTSYTKSVNNVITSINFTPITVDTGATVTVGGTPTISGTASVDQPLSVGDNVIDIVVTAADGVTSKTYTVTVTRALAPVNSFYQNVGVAKPGGSLQTANDNVVVHQGLSPNGDGISDFLVIDGIAAHPENKLTIMNRNGQPVFEAQGYDNSSKVFDGHSSKNGSMQLPGTYFYSLDYKDGNETKHKTGFIVIKY